MKAFLIVSAVVGVVGIIGVGLLVVVARNASSTPPVTRPSGAANRSEYDASITRCDRNSNRTVQVEGTISNTAKVSRTFNVKIGLKDQNGQKVAPDEFDILTVKPGEAKTFKASAFLIPGKEAATTSVECVITSVTYS